MVYDPTKPAALTTVASAEIRANFVAIATHHIGPQPPDDLQDGILWIDTSNLSNIRLRWIYNQTAVLLLENIQAQSRTNQELQKYTHTQSATVAVWSIAHNLNTTDVVVQVYDALNRLMFEDGTTGLVTVEIVDANNVQVTVNPAQTGKVVVIG
jgi:hypothetical protein